jgi:hypothetical protein
MSVLLPDRRSDRTSLPPTPAATVLRRLPAAYVSCHWRQQQAGRLFAYDLAKGAAASGRAKVSAARQLVVSVP